MTFTNDTDLRKRAQLVDAEDLIFPETQAFETSESEPETSLNETDHERLLEDQELIRLHRQWPENPFIKLIFALLITGTVASILIVLSQFMFGKSTNQTQKNLSTVETTSTQENQPSLVPKDNISGDIKAEKVTASLAEGMKQNRKKTVKKITPKSTPKKEDMQKQASVKEALPKPIPIAQIPNPIPVNTIPKPVMRNAIPQSLVRIQPKPMVTPKPSLGNQPVPPTTLQQLEEISQLGVFYGQRSGEKEATTIPEKKDNMVSPQDNILISSSSLSGSSLTIGTNVTATTILPILFDNRREQSVLLKTNTPLGELPKDTYMMANLSHQQGAITAFVTGYIVNNELKPVPEQSIIVIGENRMPLIAQHHQSNQKGGSFNRSLLKGLGKALEYDNLPDFSSVTTNGNSTISQTSRDNSNIVSGFLEGFVNELGSDLDRRASHISNDQSFWYLPAQTTVHLFVQQPIQL